jgi:hypothetical protein
LVPLQTFATTNMLQANHAFNVQVPRNWTPRKGGWSGASLACPQILGCRTELLERSSLKQFQHKTQRGKAKLMLPSWCYHDSSLDSSRKMLVLVPYSFFGINYCVNSLWILVPRNILYHLDLHFQLSVYNSISAQARKTDKQEPGRKYSPFTLQEIEGITGSAMQSEVAQYTYLILFARSRDWPRMATSLSKMSQKITFLIFPQI